LPIPTKLQRQDNSKLLIEFSDGARREYTYRELRDACPCATCREKRAAPPAAPSLLPILSPAEARPLVIESMRPVGNYAYNIVFSDGHDTGIYTFELLRQLGPPERSASGTAMRPPRFPAANG
jgi:DUF971 family protein